MTAKHLAAGSPFPPLGPGVLRLYSMRYCPFAHRVRLVLAHKNIPYETVNVNLINKPEWLFIKNSTGLIPVLERGDKLVQESDICMDYLDDITPGGDLYPEDPYLKARMKLDMARAAKFIGPFSKLVRSVDDDDQKELCKDIIQKLSAVEEMATDKYFGGDSPMMFDFYIYPWFEMFGIGKARTGEDILSADRFPRLTAWSRLMSSLPAVRACANTPEVMLKFLLMYSHGPVDYDFEV